MGSAISVAIGWAFGTTNQNVVGVVGDMGPDADIPDSVSSLTPREVAHIRSIWTLVQPDLKVHGSALFLKLFRLYPPMINKFKPFAGKTLEELEGSKRLTGHGITVMTALDSYINNLDDPIVMVEMITTSGRNHQARGVTVKEFQSLAPVLIDYLAETLGPAMTPAAKSAWIHLVDVLVSVVSSAYE